MALFDANDVQSEEMNCLLQAQDLLSQSTALQGLFEVSSAAAAAALIIVGPSQPPWNNESYTVGELENQMIWAQLYPKLDTDSFITTWSKAVAATPEKEGFFRLHIRRQVRASEYANPNGRNDIWRYFLDQTSRACEEYVENTDLNLRSQQIKRVQGPLFNNQTTHEEQGIFIYADYLIPWGGSEHSE